MFSLVQFIKVNTLLCFHLTSILLFSIGCVMSFFLDSMIQTTSFLFEQLIKNISTANYIGIQ